MRKSQISASMMCSNLVDLQATIDVFEKEKVEYLHIDVMDGEFFSHISTPMKPLLCSMALYDFSSVPVRPSAFRTGTVRDQRLCRDFLLRKRIECLRPVAGFIFLKKEYSYRH